MEGEEDVEEGCAIEDVEEGCAIEDVEEGYAIDVEQRQSDAAHGPTNNVGDEPDRRRTPLRRCATPSHRTAKLW